MDHEKVGPLDRALELILSLDAMAPAPNLPDQLNGLFEDLAKPELDEPLDVVEGSIWALWCSHPDDSAVQRMERVIGGLAQGRFDAAERLLDGMVRKPGTNVRHFTFYWIATTKVSPISKRP